MAHSMGILGILSLLSLIILPVTGAPAKDTTSARHRRDYDTAATFDHGLQHTDGSAFVGDPDILELMTVQDLAETDPELSSLNQLIKDTGATFYLEQTRDLTMFMPTNLAFQRAPIDVASLPWEAKWRILQYNTIPNHVIKLEDMTEDAVDYDSWEGAKITIKPPKLSVLNGPYTINDEAEIVGDTLSIETFNGISYKLDTLLFPPGFDATQYSGPRRKDDPESDIKVEESVSMAAKAPQHVRDINAQHARWDDHMYLRTTHAGPVVRDTFKKEQGVGVLASDPSSIKSMHVGSTPSLRGSHSGVIKTLELGDSEESAAPDNFGFAPNYVGWTRYDVVNGDAADEDAEDVDFIEASEGGLNPAQPIDISGLSKEGVRPEIVETKVSSAVEGGPSTIPEETFDISLHESDFAEVVGPIFTMGQTAGVLPSALTNPLPSQKIRTQSLGVSSDGSNKFSPFSALRYHIDGF